MCRSTTPAATGTRASPASAGGSTRTRCAASASRPIPRPTTGLSTTAPTAGDSAPTSSAAPRSPAWASTSTSTTSGPANRRAASRTARARTWARPTRHRALPPSPSGCNQEKRIRRDTPDGARRRQGGHAHRAARHRRHRAHRPHGRVLEGIGRQAPQAESMGSLKLDGLKAVRFSFADQHGVLRGKTLAVSQVEAALERGVTVTSTLLLKDTAHQTVFAAFTPGGGRGMPQMQGPADVLMIPDPSTFRVLPWAPDTGWFLCGLRFQDGKPVPFCTRQVLRKALEKLSYEFIAGLEVEFHVFRIVNPSLKPSDAGQPGSPPEVELLSTGYQYRSEEHTSELQSLAYLVCRLLLEKK